MAIAFVILVESVVLVSVVLVVECISTTLIEKSSKVFRHKLGPMCQIFLLF